MCLRLKTVSLVVKNSQGAEALVKLYEGKLCEEDAVNGDLRSTDAVMSTLKVGRRNKYVFAPCSFIVALVLISKTDIFSNGGLR